MSAAQKRSPLEPPFRLLPWLLVLALSLAAAGCRQEGGVGEPGPATLPEEPHAEQSHSESEGVVELTAEAASLAEIRSAVAEVRTLDGRIETTGEVDFDHNRLAHVSPRITGRLHSVDAVLGAVVERGQTLATIDSIELGRTKATFLQARAREELARDNLERERSLFADRISSEQDFLTAQAAHREALTELRTAEETLHLYGLSQAQVEGLDYDDPQASLYPVRAPFGGIVIERHATLGELVTPERNLFTIGDLGRVWVWIDVYERDLARVHLEDGVEVRVSAYPQRVFRGEVTYLSSRVDGETRTVRARLDVDNEDGELRPGMFARVVLSDPHAGDGDALAAPSLAVPAAAVLRDVDERIVFVPLEGEHRFERRRVQTGREVGGWTEVLAGLSPGERVVVEGVFVLKSEMFKDRLGGGHHH